MKEGPVNELMLIGKQKGEFISRLNDSTMEWFLKQDWFEMRYPILAGTFDDELEYRNAFDLHVGEVHKSYKLRRHIND